MPAETKVPDAVLDSLNYTTLNLADIDEDPDSPDAAYGTWDDNGNTSCRVSFGTPTGNPSVGAGLQEFRVLIRRTGAVSLGWSLQLWENGAQVGSALATGTLTTTSTVVSGTWDASSLSLATGENVECRLEQTSGGTGGGRQGIEVGAVEWNVTYDLAIVERLGTAGLIGTGLTGDVANLIENHINGLIGIGQIGNIGSLNINTNVISGLISICQFGNIGKLNLSNTNGLNSIGSIGQIGNLRVAYSQGLVGIGSIGGMIGRLIENAITTTIGTGQIGGIINLNQNNIINVIGVGILGPDASIAGAIVATVGILNIGQLGIFGNLIESSSSSSIGTGQIGNKGHLILSGNNGLFGTGQITSIGSNRLNNLTSIIGIGILGSEGSSAAAGTSTIGLISVGQISSIGSLNISTNIGLLSTELLGITGNINVGSLTGLNGHVVLNSINKLISNGAITLNENGSFGISANLNQNQKAGLIAIGQLLVSLNVISIGQASYLEFVLSINRNPSFILEINRNSIFVGNI